MDGNIVCSRRRFIQSAGIAAAGTLLASCSLPAGIYGHAVALVGYGRGSEYPGGGYFIFRNNWGRRSKIRDADIYRSSMC